MPFSLTSAGLTIQTYTEALADVQADFRSRISSRIATTAGSFAGQLQRIIALYDYRAQEKLQQLVQMFDPRLATGVHLDQRLADLGVSREPARRAEVLGTAVASGSMTLNDGTRVSVGGYTFEVIDGPYSIVGAGSITGVRVRSQLYQTIDVSTLGAWTIVDAVANWDSFGDTSQPINGNVQETDAAYRARAEEERYARAQDPLDAIEAGVGLVDGVDFARAYHNVDPTNDPNADGIPYDSINVVVNGGTDEDVAQAIENYGPAATRFYGAVGVTLGTGARQRVVGFDRVADVDMHIRVSLTTSTSEESGDALSSGDLDKAIKTALGDFTASRWVQGKDVIPAELLGAVINAGIPAIDAITVEVSDDGASWSVAKYPITIRQRAIYSDARVTIVES
ncbi:MAG: baseplate J/gp47 family protein [Planctomycetota bacterium]|nr:baseplate J/gp47 family protein [Planctomycetota bacterium]